MTHPTNKGARLRIRTLKAKSKRTDADIYVYDPKKWSQLYGRSVKLKRAQKLGFDYPRRSVADILGDDYGYGCRKES